MGQKLSRREFVVLGSAAATVATAGVPASGEPRAASAVDAVVLDAQPFTLGVASGHPDESSVVLWTRWAPDPLGQIPNQPVEVNWEVAADDGFADIVSSGTTTATPAFAHAVHVLVQGLESDRWYWYRFEAGGVRSRAGRTRTLPPPGSDPERMRFAVASCQNFPVNGRYAAYRDMAEQDLDFVVHLGDYIYESAGTSLAEYRRLHALYKTAPELREAHARFPFITVWDDHEVVNNWWRDDPRNEARRANAFRAYYEHLPMRTAPAGADWDIYHGFAWGRLAQFFVLDTRQYRDDQACGDGMWVAPCPEVYDELRTMTGPEQKQWLVDGLAGSSAVWNVIAQQTIMAEFDYETGPGTRINLDQWDGYPAARARVLDAITTHQPRNPIVLSGDWHSHWVNTIQADFADAGSDVLAVEFVGTSISSGCGWDWRVKEALYQNPQVKFFEGQYRGYLHFDVTPQAWVGTLRVVGDAVDPGSPAYTIAEFEVVDGTPGTAPPAAAFAQTGRLVAGPQSKQGPSEIVLGNDKLAMAIAVDYVGGQLGQAHVGKPLDLAATGHFDQLDWINLPYVAATQPGGAGGWEAGWVDPAGDVEVLSAGPAEAVVRTASRAREVPVNVVTTYTVRPGEPWITAESAFTNTGTSSVTVWLGDVIDHDGDGQSSGLAGHGAISATPGQYNPTGPWIGMTGTDPQTYGLIYESSAFIAYGSGLWVQSQWQRTLAPGVPWTLRRRITAVDTRNYPSPWAILDGL